MPPIAKPAIEPTATSAAMPFSAKERTRRVVIIGGGIAGLTLARALRQYDAHCRVTLLEKQPGPPPDRYGITLAPNGLEALATLGLLPQVLGSGRKLEAFEVRSADRGRTARFDFASLHCRVPYAVGILPRRLFDILAEEVDTYAELLFDHQLVDIRQRDGHGPYEVVTRSGERQYSFSADLVVGADGVRSAVRPYVTDEASELEVDEAYQVIIGKGIDDVHSVQQHLAPGHLLGLVPVAEDRTFIFWFCRRHELRRMREQPLAQFKQTLTAHAPAIEASISELSSWDEVFPVAVTMTRSQRWFSGGIALIGDTVHATTPSLAQGANMALVDAVTLGAKVAAWSHEEGTASLGQHLKAFVDERRSQARAQHLLGRMIVRSNHLTSPWLTDLKLASLRMLQRWSPIRRTTLEALTGLRP